MISPIRTFLAALLAFTLVSSLAHAQSLASTVRLAPELAPVKPPPVPARAPRPLARARILVAVGVGLLLGAAGGVALTAGKHKCYGRAKERYEGPLYVGGGLATVGLGLSIGGIIGLVRAGPEARRSKESKFLPLYGFGLLAAAFTVTLFGALPEAIDCASS